MTAGHRVLVTAMPPSRAPGAVPTAPVGRLLAGHLLRRGVRVRALVPPGEAAGWPAGAEIVEGLVTDPGSAPEAFGGVSHLCLAGLVSMVPANLRVLVNQALRGGLRRAAVLASHGSDFEEEYSPETWQWLAFEQALHRHGVEWTYVRPTGLFANALTGGYPVTGSSWAQQIAEGAAIREFLPEVPYPFTDEDDVAAVLASVLLDGGHHGQVLDISGTMISAAARLRLISEALGRAARLSELASAGEARAYWTGQGWPKITIDVTLWVMTTFASSAQASLPVMRRQEQAVASALGRPPNSFADWLSRNLAAFQPGAPPLPAPGHHGPAQPS